MPMIYLDATSIRDWTCHEYHRIKWVTHQVPLEPAIHRELGIGIHKAIEAFWKNSTFEQAVKVCQEYLASVQGINLLPPKQLEKWQEMCGYFPDLIAAYYDNVSQDTDQVYHLDDGPCLEYEWQVPLQTAGGYDRHEWTNGKCDKCGANGNMLHSDTAYCSATGITLCGRLDLVLRGPVIHDLKTASDMGGSWKKDYREDMLRDVGLGMYDWYLRRVGHPAQNIVLDVLIKPYRSKPARYERFELPELVTEGYRKRFDHLLEWSVREIAEYYQKWATVRPWPMVQQLCRTKFGPCEYLESCLWGKQNLKPREEHLSLTR